MSGKGSPLGQLWAEPFLSLTSFILIPFLSHLSLISPDPFAHFSRFTSLIVILCNRESLKAERERRDIVNEGRTLLQKQFAPK